MDGRAVAADWVLAACAPAVVDAMLGRTPRHTEGSQLKVNMVLRRLPRLRTGVDPTTAFAGTLHLEQGYQRLLDSYTQADGGQLPDPLPAEVYCHSLTDPSILSAELAERGYHTLTLFGLHAPARLFTGDSTAGDATTGGSTAWDSTADDSTGTKDRAVAAALASLQRHLDEPLDDVLATDAHGRPCLEAATPLDLERSLRMPGGNIFHGDLEWPWLDDDEPADTPAQRAGVAIADCQRVLLAGAGTRRGGGVSGLGGLHAARAVLES